MIDVNRTLSDYQTVNLGDYFSFYQYSGYEVESMEVATEVYDRSMEISMIADRAIEDTAYAGEGYQTVVLYPRSRVVLRSNTNELEIMARGPGQVRIDQVVLRVSRY